ncbi:sigma-70 family RNA polymerase sigma factor [Methylobacillus gramineus]|uniref:sigma-70 family RNA polymerase sigma factor n=1 Tax=Methylobacillus gramineus TaxID=755169 RepID=UPI001CFFC854|nr:sigma-70 family RNA polymerase sigma factor [Methylobacillus gramineus]MCB5185750.1 sigma-70 family RNA polymerase sigma factor [Methylobacillus gramineus]
MPSSEPSAAQRLSHLYTDNHAWLFAWLRKKLGCPHEAADLVQDTFTRILSSRDILFSIKEPRAYLTTTAKHLLINQARRRAIEEAYLAGLIALGEDHAPSPEQVLVAVEALAQISAVLEGLADKPRTAFLLRYLDGLSHAEIAAALGVSTKMIQKYLVQALVHCHAALGQDQTIAS